jgi:Cu/Ag efflux pump CusA
MKHLAEVVETALNGRVVSQVLEQQQTFDLVVWMVPAARQSLENIRNLSIDTPTGSKVPLAAVATIGKGTGPNTINRENVSRLIVIAANAQGRDLRSVVNEIQAQVHNTKFAEGMPVREILIQGSMERLNAILMTAFTSALGLAPLVFQGGSGKEILQPLSIVVLGGLFTSTALTLLILPALYARFGKYLFPKPKP